MAIFSNLDLITNNNFFRNLFLNLQIRFALLILSTNYTRNKTTIKIVNKKYKTKKKTKEYNGGLSFHWALIASATRDRDIAWIL